MLLRSEMLCGNMNCDYTPLCQLSPQHWRKLMVFAQRHGVKYLLFEAISHLPQEFRPPSDLYLEWYVQSVKSEERYRYYTRTLEELSALMADGGITMMVIKGYTFAQLYRVPARREGGDIDIFLFGKQSAGDALISGDIGRVREPRERSKHSQFIFKGINVDNHKTFVSDAKGLTPKLALFYGRIEQKIQSSVEVREVTEVKIGNQTIYTLIPAIAALHLITHTMRHVVVAAASMRHYCDWVVFFNYNRDRLNRDELLSLIEECDLGVFVANVEHFCEMRLGFEPFFKFDGRHKIVKGTLSIEQNVLSYKRQIPMPNRLSVIINSLRKIYCSQRYYAAYIGLNSCSDYLVPNIISRIKQLCR